MTKFNTEDFFKKFPIHQPKELTNNDLSIVLKICYDSLNEFDWKNTSISKSEKIEAYKEYCMEQINNSFAKLNPESRIELNKFFNLYGTHIIINHLTR